MRHFTAVIGTLALLIAGCQSTNSNAPVKTVPMPSGLGDDFVVMQRELTFTTEQKVKFDEALKARNAGYDTWAKSPAGQNYARLRGQESAAKRNNDTQKIAEIEASRAEQVKVREDLRREFNKCLTLEQQRQWAGRNLYIRAIAALQKPILTDDQSKQAREIANKIAADRVKSSTAEKDPYLLLDEAAVNRTTEEIRSKVLQPNKG